MPDKQLLVCNTDMTRPIGAANLEQAPPQQGVVAARASSSGGQLMQIGVESPQEQPRVAFVNAGTGDAGNLCGKYLESPAEIKSLCRYCECPSDVESVCIDGGK